MAGTASLSSCFVIEFLPSNNAATVISNPGRSYRISAVGMNNTSGGAVDVDVTNDSPVGGGPLLPAGTWGVANKYCFALMTAANGVVSSGSTVTIQTAAFGSSPQIDLFCTAADGGTALVVT
jgi:hypothetical protein